MRKKKIRYYREFTDDFEVTKNQDIKLSADYEYIRTDFLSRLKSAVIYSAAVVFGVPYCRFFLHTRFKNLKVLKRAKGEGFFIYGNHTQPFGDVFLPALCALPKRIYTVVSPANFGIPIIGRLLPYLGAIPVADSSKAMVKFTDAIEQRISKNKVITIYPEAHVWEYYTEIRPFGDSAFRYPVKLQKPSFSMTVTYQKRRFLSKPRTTVYVDGPFYPDSKLSKRGQSVDLKRQVYECMKERSKLSDYSYIEYKKLTEDNTEN